MEQRTSKRLVSIDAIKGLAIICVVSAHCNAVDVGQNQFADICSLILSNIGTWGVGCFFFLAGILYRPDRSKTSFWKKKCQYLAVPWLISATFVYLYVHLRKPPIHIVGWLNFVIGNGSYCYYMTVLIAIFALYSFMNLYGHKIIQSVFMVITVISVLFFSNFLAPTPYLNVLNWIGFFAIGNMIGKTGFGKFEQLLTGKLWRILIYVIALSLMTLHVIQSNSGSYFAFDGLAAICGNLCIVMLGANLANNKIMQKIGKDSYFIYLWHMPLAGIIVRLTYSHVLSFLVLLRPMFIIIVMECAVFLAEKAIPQKYRFVIGCSN